MQEKLYIMHSNEVHALVTTQQKITSFLCAQVQGSSLQGELTYIWTDMALPSYMQAEQLLKIAIKYSSHYSAS